MENIKITNTTKGVIFIILSAFGFAMMSAFVRLAGDLPSFQKTFFRNLIAVFISAVMIIKNKQSFIGKKENQKLLMLRSFCGTCGIVFNFYAIDNLSTLSDANMLNKLSPFFAVIFSALFLKEKINVKQFIVLMIAFVGAMFVVKPTFNMDIVPALSGVLGGISAAAAYTCVRALGKREQHYTIVFYFSTFSCLITLPVVCFVYEPMEFMQLLYLILAGVFASIGQFGITLAYKYAPAKEISIFDYTNVVFAAIISIVIFGAVPDIFSFIGYGIIFIASLIMFLYNKKLEHK